MIRNNNCLATARNNLMWDSVTGDSQHIRLLCFYCTDSVQAKLPYVVCRWYRRLQFSFLRKHLGEVLWVYLILLTKVHLVRAEQVREMENEREGETEKGQGEQ